MSIRRTWLNPVGSSNNGWMKYGIQKVEEGYHDYSLKIADCSRVVDFTFEFDTKTGRREARKKLLIMENALLDMREQCEGLMKLRGELA